VTWNAPAAACRFDGSPGGATVGLGAAADGLGESEEALVAKRAASTTATAPTTINTIGHRLRRPGGALGGPGALCGGATLGDVGRPCGPPGGGGKSSIGPLPVEIATRFYHDETGCATMRR
jgi:hypothetical protein